MIKGNFLKPAVALFVLTGLGACDKKEDKKPEEKVVNTEIRRGFPENPRKINGYLYAANSEYINGSSVYTQLSVNAFFGDPPRDFLGSFDHHTDQMRFISGDNTPNVSVGTLSYNENILGGVNSTFYSRTFTIYNPGVPEAHWVSEGNKTFLPMDITVPGGFPVLNQQAVNSYSVISKNQDFVLDFSKFISNCDSVAVTFGTQGSFGYIRKTAKFSDGQISFSKEEISDVASVYSSVVQYAGYNYSTKTTNNKIFVFELGSKIRLYTTFSN